jgi:V/A-type H+-transporting ATPase subunit I
MTEIRKLKTLVLEEHIDAVVRALIEVGAVQIIDIRERLEFLKGTLEPYEVSVEVADQCSNLLSRISTTISRIDELVEPIEVQIIETPTKRPSIPRKRSEEVLTEVEQRLPELEKELSSVEERLANIKIQHQTLIEKLEELEKRQSMIDNLRTLTGGLEKTLLEGKLQELTEQIEETPKGELSTLIDRLSTLKKRQSLIDKLKTTTSGLEKTLLEGKLQELTKKIEEEARRGEQSIARVSADLETKTIEMKELISKEKPILEKMYIELLFLEETSRREELIIDTKSQFMRTNRTIYFEAYLSSSHMEEVESSIKEASGGDYLISDERPSPEERAPTAQILAPSYMMAFEKLTTASGLPSSKEVNPIPIMAITFPLLFGIMFADVGQGAIFVILGSIVTYFRGKVKLEEIGDITRYFLVSGELFIFIGLSAIFFGFIFGEFFGPSGVLHPISLGKIGPFYLGGFEPTHEPMKMLKFAIFVGVIHLSLGLIMRFINEVKKRHYKLVPIPIYWLWLLIGGVYMWAYWGGISNISMWFSEGTLMLVGLIILPLVLIIVFTGIAESYMEGIGFGVEVFAETLSHTLSYGRLMALSLVHSVMNNLFLVLGGVEHGHFPITSIPLIAIGTILVMTVEGLIVFVHTLRLHWIEWFSKFYSGEGIPFKPLKRLDKNYRGIKRE